MWQLATCDIWRDGGSYSATLVSGERIVSLWLQVGHWNHPDEISYEALFVSNGSDPTLREEQVSTGPAEAEWLRVLETDVDCESASEGARDRLGELIQVLRVRGR